MPREYRHNAPSLPRLHHANEQAHEPHGEVEPETRPKPPTLGCQRPTVAARGLASRIYKFSTCFSARPHRIGPTLSPRNALWHERALGRRWRLARVLPTRSWSTRLRPSSPETEVVDLRR